MRHVVATLVVIGLLVLASDAVDVHGQDACQFVGGFARLREMVGPEKIGACLEDEHFNMENGNAEQRTAGGLLVWRKSDNFTAFTDGGTTWVIGPDGLQSRPNDERFAWESEPVASTAPVASSAPAATPTPTRAASPSPAPASAAANAAPPTATSSPTPVPATPTKTATPTPALKAKFTEKPDDVDAGQDARFEVETSADEGTCTLNVAYRGQAAAGIMAVDIDDNKCDLKYNVPKGTKTGKAKAQVVVTSKDTSEGTATIEEDFEVKEGDAALAGDIDVEVEGDDLPESVKTGEEITIAVKSSVKKSGQCEMSIAWPKVAATSGENKTPDGDGKCSWKVVVPTDIPKKGTATLTVVVRKSTKTNRTDYRVLTYEFEVKK